MENIENYLNTMIFIIITKGLTIALLLLLLFRVGQEMSFIIITFQLGLLGVAIWAIVVIVKYNKRMQELKAEMNKMPANIDTCPSYFTKQISEENTIQCINNSIFDDGVNKFSMTESNITPVNVSTLLRDSKQMDMMCNKVNDYAEYPWAEYKAKCNIL